MLRIPSKALPGPAAVPMPGIAIGVVFLCMLSGHVHAGDLPGDVATFIEDRQQCDHFRGEEPYDEARRVEISAALDRYCRGTDQRLKKLKAQYRQGHPEIIAALSAFEENVE